MRALSRNYQILGFPGITYKRETDSWLISYEIFDAKSNQTETPTIVTFEDAVRYLHRMTFDQELSKVFQAMTTVMSLVEANAAEQIQNTYNTLKDVIYPIQLFG